MHLSKTAAGLYLILCMPASQVAAAQYCGGILEGGAVTRPTEAEARKDAETWWTSRAGSIGKGFQDWSIAQDKKINCTEKADGSYRCVASAKPCLPEGTLPSDIPKVEM